MVTHVLKQTAQLYKIQLGDLLNKTIK